MQLTVTYLVETCLFFENFIWPGSSLTFGKLASPFASGFLITTIKTVGRLHIVELGEGELVDVLVEFGLEFEWKAVLSG